MEQPEYDLIMANYGVTRQHSYDIVLLPWGATEPHNLHLPYLTDCILSHDLSTAYPDFFIACGEWFKMAPVAEYFDQPGDHADEVETSVMMHYHPEWVNLSEAGPGEGHGFGVKALRQGKVWLPRHWNLASPDDTGIGNPALATAEKGRRFAEAVVAEYADFLRDFKRIRQPQDLYE